MHSHVYKSKKLRANLAPSSKLEWATIKLQDFSCRVSFNATTSRNDHLGPVQHPGPMREMPQDREEISFIQLTASLNSKPQM
jgi:hypothetical protein